MSIIVRKKLTTLFTEALDQFMKPHAVFAGIYCLNTYSTLANVYRYPYGGRRM